MGLLNKIFKSSQDISKEGIVEVPWHPLTRLEQLDEIVKLSEKKTVVIFKHSTRCGISRMVLRSFEKEFEDEPEGAFRLYFLDLLSNRDISDEIAGRFDVRHESPQMLVIKDGKVVHHDSHHSIKAATLAEFV